MTLVRKLTRESQCLKSDVNPEAQRPQAFRNLLQHHPSDEQDFHLSPRPRLHIVKLLRLLQHGGRWEETGGAPPLSILSGLSISGIPT